jgi:hypothetical protein
MNPHIDVNKVREFLSAFEEVFDRDWPHTKEMLGIQAETQQQKQAAAKAALETIPIIAETGTFLNPKIEDKSEDWGNRGKLLETYRTLRAALS